MFDIYKDFNVSLEFQSPFDFDQLNSRKVHCLGKSQMAAI